jgi:hypothetical protein
MIAGTPTRQGRLRQAAQRIALISLAALLAGSSVYADDDRPPFGFQFWPGNLVVSRSVYDNNANNIQVGATLPPNCASGCSTATNNGLYPQVFNNAVVDGSFGISSKIFLDQITPFGWLLNSLEVPNNTQKNAKDQLVTSSMRTAATTAARRS